MKTRTTPIRTGRVVARRHRRPPTDASRRHRKPRRAALFAAPPPTQPDIAPTTHTVPIRPQTESESWRRDLVERMARHPEQGISHDLTAMTLSEQLGVYRYLCRLDHAEAVE